MSKTFWAGEQLLVMVSGWLNRLVDDSPTALEFLNGFPTYPAEDYVVYFRQYPRGSTLDDKGLELGSSLFTILRSGPEYSIVSYGQTSGILWSDDMITWFNIYKDTHIFQVEIYARAVTCTIYNGTKDQLESMKISSGDPVGTPNGMTFGEKLNHWYFHSNLLYLSNDQREVVTITHPTRYPDAPTVTRKHSSITYNLNKGVQEYTLATHDQGLDAIYVVQMDGSQLMNGQPLNNVGASARAVGVHNTGTSIVLRETYMTHRYTLPSITKTYKVFMLKEMVANNDPALSGLKITPTSFQAGAGRLDTNKKYLRKDLDSPEFYLTTAKTADAFEGKLKVVAPSGKVVYHPLRPNTYISYNSTQADGFHHPNIEANYFSITNAIQGYPWYYGNYAGGQMGNNQDDVIENWSSDGNGIGVTV